MHPDLNSPLCCVKTIVYFFERFYYQLEDAKKEQQGIIVFDEFEKTKSKVLLGQMEKYFMNTATGRARSSLIIPEPFFVHSDLSSLIQLADLIAYIVSWGFRLQKMTEPARLELGRYIELLKELRFLTKRVDQTEVEHWIWGFTYISDLRGKNEKGNET
jgi:hypothetical protein